MNSSPGRVLFVEPLGVGEFLWSLPLARALRRRGQDVAYLTFARNETACRKAGVTYREWVDPEARALPTSSRGHGSWVRQGLGRWRARAARINAAVPGLFEAVERESREANLLVVARFNALGARVACEKLGVPLVVLHPQPAVLRSCFHEPGLPIPQGNQWALRSARALCWFAIDLVADHFVLPELNGHRRRLGLAPVRRPFNRWVHEAGLNVGLFPEFFGPPQPDWPSDLILAGFPFVAGEDDAALPPRLSRFLDAGEPPVVFTRGSHDGLAPAFFDEALEACTRLGVRGVLAGRAPALDAASLPSSIVAIDFAPFSAVLPRAAAIVHHGGIGTSGHALVAGIPQIVTPLFDDQFYNGRRLAQLGVARTLPRRRRSAPDISQALGTVLESPGTLERCRHWRNEAGKAPGLDAACREIEAYWQRPRNSARMGLA